MEKHKQKTHLVVIGSREIDMFEVQDKALGVAWAIDSSRRIHTHYTTLRQFLLHMMSSGLGISMNKSKRHVVDMLKRMTKHEGLAATWRAHEKKRACVV